jgi:hypothetical protein
MAHAKIVNYLDYQNTRDWIQVAMTNGLDGLAVADYGIHCEFRLKGVQQLRTFRRYHGAKVYALGRDELGNLSIFTSVGTYQLTGDEIKEVE